MFLVAYKRFVDHVPMAIDYELVRGGKVDVFGLLWDKLRLDGNDAHKRCEDFAREAAHIADRREELQKKLERLIEAMKHLTTFTPNSEQLQPTSGIASSVPLRVSPTTS